MPQSFSITDIGLRREMNQDYVFSSDLPLGSLSCLYLVADGMGGGQGGAFASEWICEELKRYGYIVIKGSRTVYYSSEMRRIVHVESYAKALGLRFEEWELE